MFSSVWVIAKNSFLEIVRQPIYGLLVLAGMAAIALSPLVSVFALLQGTKLVIDMGLATIFLVGIALSVVGATQVIGREIEAKTAGAVLSKPVDRFIFVAGKFLGVGGAIGVAGFLFTVVLLMTVRVGVPESTMYEMDVPAFLSEVVPFLLAFSLALYCNYFYRWNFGSTAMLFAVPLYAVFFAATCFVGSDWRLDWIATAYVAKHCDQVLIAAALVLLGVWVVASVAVAASTRVSVVANVLICAGVFFVGMVSRYLFGQYADVSYAARVAYRVVPSLQFFWVGDQLFQPEPYVPVSYLLIAIAYAAAYSAAMVAFASYLFEGREVV